MPHAYKAGLQTQLLREKIENMAEGGTFVMVTPPNPYRCPPGPYERACMIAKQFKEKNPTAKIIILDPKEKHSKQALFQEAWTTHYDGMIEWIPGDFGGKVTAVNAADMTITTEDGEVFNADAANIIPPQKAGIIAEAAGATDNTGWCPIDPHSMASKLVDDIHIVGDACIPGDMPKSGFSANSQAKVCAMAIRHALTGSKKFPARFRNTCWSPAGVRSPKPTPSKSAPTTKPPTKKLPRPKASSATSAKVPTSENKPAKKPTPGIKVFQRMYLDKNDPTRVGGRRRRRG